ncbi:MAG: hypothetical protein ACRD24_16640 [Terriglobales bacterium]
MLGEVKKEKGKLVMPAGEFRQGVFVTPPQTFTDQEGRFAFETEPAFFDPAKEYTLALPPKGVLQTGGKPVTFRVGPAAGEMDLGKITVR